MDKKSKILLFSFFSIIIIVTGISYYKYFILKDYLIEIEVDCNPKLEKCFIYECDPSVDEECPKNVKKRISYYKIIRKKANTIPNCDPNSENCSALKCNKSEDCEEVLCDEANLQEGERCSSLGNK